jgi:predicted kinase
VRADQPPAADGLADREALPERAVGREEMAQRLRRLPPGHPSSAFEADGTPRPPEPGLRGCELPDGSPADPTDSRPLSDAEYAEHVTKVRELLDKARADGLATELKHTIDPDHEQWTEDRTVMHDAIIANLYAATADAPCERRAILAGGLPGAGKTTVLEQYAGIERSRYLTINPDEIKEQMAKRGMIPEVAGLTPMEASDLVHEESSHVAKRLCRRATREGKNVIWDITMASRESTEKRISELRGAAYTRVEGIFVDIPIEVGVRRSDGRHREGHDSYRAGYGLGGRFVPAEVIAPRRDRTPAAVTGGCSNKSSHDWMPGCCAITRWTAVPHCSSIPAAEKRKSDDQRCLRPHQGPAGRNDDARRGGPAVPRAKVAAPQAAAAGELPGDGCAGTGRPRAVRTWFFR